MIKLLAIDDELGVCEAIRETFSYFGFTVFVATNAKGALKILKKEKPKIIFLDVIMPGIDGLSLLKQIKEIDPGVIVIMVTRKDDAETRNKAFELGASEFITKPFEYEDLRFKTLAKIETLLGEQGELKKPKVLIVDDESHVREDFKNFISRRYECDLFEADNGDFAVKQVKELLPDIILLDIRMPGLGWVDVIEKIKEICPLARIIVVTAFKDQDRATKAMSLGAFEYIVKSDGLSILRERFEAALLSKGMLIKKSKKS